MKIVTTILIVLLVACLGAGGYAYLKIYQPMAADIEKFKAGQPEFDKARKDLKRYQDREKQETAWTVPVADAFRKELAAEIAGGKAEVVVAGSRVILNIAEPVLYTPQSVTFAKDSQPMQLRLAALLKDLKDKEITIVNTTLPAPASGKGRKRVPAKDARTLAAQRSHELAKALFKNGVADEALAAASAAARLPERGFKIKGQKTMIIVSAPVTIASEAAPAAAASKQEPKSAPASSATRTAPPAGAPPQASGASLQKPIPISPAPPKKVQ